MAHEFVYTMQDVGKVVGVDRVILEGITLAFFPGAKIGVLGANGAGKSSLLRIMAGLDDDHLGEARPTPGVRVGHLAQEPALDPGKTVREVVEEGVGETRALLHRFEEISAKFGEPLDDDAMNALLEEQAELQDADRCDRRLGARSHARRGDGGAARSRARDRRLGALGRRAAPRGAVPPAAPEARSAAARRAHQPPRRRVGRVARAVPAGTIRARSSRSRTTATSSTTRPSGSSSSTAAAASRGRATTPRGSSRRSSGSRSRRSRRARAGARSSASSSGSRCRRARARRRARRGSPRSSGCRAKRSSARPTPWRSRSRPGRGSATWCSRWSTSRRATTGAC